MLGMCYRAVYGMCGRCPEVYIYICNKDLGKEHTRHSTLLQVAVLRLFLVCIAPCIMPSCNVFKHRLQTPSMLAVFV